MFSHRFRILPSAHAGPLLLCACVAAALALNRADAAETGRTSDIGDPGRAKEVEVCLAVAGDPQANSLYKTLRQNLVTPAFLGALRDKRNQSGYATLLMCAHIEHAWRRYMMHQTWMPSGDGNDGRPVSGLEQTQSALVIQFSDLTQTDVVIPANTIARLISLPDLLPPSYYGGLALRNVTVRGPLVLNHLRVRIPITFTEVVFLKGEYPRKLFELPNVKVAVSVLDAHFEKRVSFFGVTFCGHFRIHGSRFEQKIQFDRVKNIDTHRFDSSESKCEEKNDPRIFIIDNSHIGVGALVIESKLRGINFSRNKMDDLGIFFSLFNGSIEIEDNITKVIHISDTQAGFKILVKANKISSDLIIQNSDAEKLGNINNHEESSKEKGFVLSGNSIQGGFQFTGLDSLKRAEDVSFNFNRVRSDSKVELPESLHGEVDLSGSQFDSKLTITHRMGDESSTQGGHKPRAPRPAGKDRVNEERQQGVYCKKKARKKHGLVSIGLDAVRVRHLRWDLPIRCEYEWFGSALEFDLWDTALDKATSQSSANASLKSWRTIMKKPDVDALTTISEYLRLHGDLVASRELKVEAKRLNYSPECDPHQSLFKCMGRIAARTLGIEDDGNITEKNGDNAEQNNGSGDSSTRKDGEADRTLEETVTALGRITALFFLNPTGYGAAPERAILWVAGGVFVFWLIYYAYTWKRRRTFRQTYAALRGLLKSLEKAAPDQDYHQRIDDLRTQIKDSHAYFRGGFDVITPKPSKVKHLDELAEDTAELCGELKVDRPSGVDFKNLGIGVAGNSKTFGFSHFDATIKPSRFSLLRYSLDTMLPVINLHAYMSYYPESGRMRGITMFQHIIGWWLLTAFLASVTIL